MPECNNLDPRDLARYRRDRERYPLFADDPTVVRPPRTIQESAARRDWYRADIRRRLQMMHTVGFMTAVLYLKQCRIARIPPADVWAALRWFRANDLGWEYAADALRALLRQHGIEPPMPPASWARCVFGDEP